MKVKKTMNNVRKYTKPKKNLTIKAKIDLRPKTIVKTMAIVVSIAIAIMGGKKWL